jgi:hypothetical protein
MKKPQAAVFLITVIMFFILIGCEQNKIPKIEEISNNIPDWIEDNPPEDILWGVGEGNLSTVNASCEQAKFNAQADICRQISSIVRHVETSYDDPSMKNIYEKSDFYENELYMFLFFYCSDQVLFELSEFIKIERRTRTSDGKIWYLVSLRKNDAKNIQPQISQYNETLFNDHIENIEGTLDIEMPED